ncbi:hypothetical protein NFI96_032932, partial [Prochilodus magdalenae]
MSQTKASQVRAMLRDLLSGREDPEGFFCLCLSALGDRDTRALFLDFIKPLASGHIQLYRQLTAIFLDYFSQDDEEALEVAIALSLHDTSHRDELPGSSSSDLLAKEALGDSQAGDTEESFKKECHRKNTRTTDVIKTENSSDSSSCPADDESKNLDNLNHSVKPKKSRRYRGRKKQQLMQNPSAPRPVILWLRRDLRIWDNPALIGCLKLGAPIIPVFLWNVAEEEGSGVTVATGGASKYWLHQALECLNRSLEERGSHLVTQRAEVSSLAALQALVAETGAGAVVATALYEPWLKDRDDSVWAALEKEGIKCHIYHSYCLRDPYTVSTKGVGLQGIGSVSHFMSCCQQTSGPPLGTPLDAPCTLPAPSFWPQGCPLTQLGLARMPRRKDGTEIDWAANIRKAWNFSEDGACARLQTFLKDVESTLPVMDNSRGSLPTSQVPAEAGLEGSGILAALPALRWSSERAHLKAWQRGQTGYPLVDAAMRQLWLTGWMNNYMRHVVASFLIAYLHIAWQEGYRWFQDTLVDADVAIDAMMWQNGGMCGLDHWNFVMHPVDAALTCDPYGNYVRQWCPELKALPDDLIHKPWKCPSSVLRRAGVVFGQNYPERIVVDLEERRAQSLQDVTLVRKRFSEYVCQQSGCDLVPLPAKLIQDAMGSGNDIVQHRGKDFLLPVITRMEFKHPQENTDTHDNPYSAVLKGYVSRNRDEKIAFLNERDFTASV